MLFVSAMNSAPDLTSSNHEGHNIIYRIFVNILQKQMLNN